MSSVLKCFLKTSWYSLSLLQRKYACSLLCTLLCMKHWVGSLWVIQGEVFIETANPLNNRKLWCVGGLAKHHRDSMWQNTHYTRIRVIGSVTLVCQWRTSLVERCQGATGVTLFSDTVKEKRSAILRCLTKQWPSFKSVVSGWGNDREVRLREKVLKSST